MSYTNEYKLCGCSVPRTWEKIEEKTVLNILICTLLNFHNTTKHILKDNVRYITNFTI